ncbi:penicillin acylase family protein [Methylobacterium frigidaeris]|uniref:Penicillin acylase 2 proenzyme n=1 Tax=Methylobacterium frigidaeris TaxID=2038277 RepID=A0AA37M8C4_9HYPH|nr:penicillin acylase family protein [Methylobacterium frigidaeris]GJD65726.1 Penicillin acylase 2 proenzyme [Methylobacterium frigidaeris]
MSGTDPTQDVIAIAGLTRPAKIRIDPWGICHLRAESLDDLFFLQGFNAARDRLWQIDLWRKRGLGRLAADFGPGYLAQDRASRAFLYRGDMAAEWTSYAPDARAIVEAFTRGINAYVALTRREPERLPDEFRLFGTEPALWAPEDVVRIRSHGLTRNALSEILRANVASRYGDATDLLRKNLEPRVTPGNPGGLDLSQIPVAALDLFKLGTAGVLFTKERLAASLADAEAWTRVTDLGEVVRDAAWEGSNNWAVAGTRTATGRPILAGDPHRAHAVPSLRYLVHLSAPGFDAIGAGEPAVPGLCMGHNGEAAFAITIFGADQEDLYVYETKPGDPDRYRYEGEWVPMTIVEETVAVKGAPDQALRLRFTRHGPVIHADPAGNRAIALRSVWFEPGSAAYLASLSTMRARTLPEYRAAAKRWGAPSLNHVYADTGGTIAWFPAGYTPNRPNWDGLLPVPGDGRFEWAGFHDLDAMPRLENPPEGFVASANEANMPADWPHAERQVGYEWLEGSRARRIRAVLSGAAGHAIADSAALQTDVVSMPARRLSPLLERLPGSGPAGPGRALLLSWDGRLTIDSGAGLLSELWWTRHLKPALFALLIDDPAVRTLMLPGDVEGILQALEAPDSRFGDDPVAARDGLLAETLAAAFAEASARYGGDPARWRWGDLHHGFFEHAASPAADADLRSTLDVGPLEKPGSASTVMHAAYRSADFRVTNGASVRFVIDVGDWDNSVCINAPGQSGDPRSPHYRDLAPLWARGDYVPMLYSRGAVDAASVVTIRLVPEDRP